MKINVELDDDRLRKSLAKGMSNARYLWITFTSTYVRIETDSEVN